MGSHRSSVLPVTAPAAHISFSPASDDERQVVRDHLERILASPVFRNSTRYAGVLKYIVNSTLDGAASHLKERTIGVEVFGRAPDYDTTTDHVVRSAAAEIRKRLAQYYQDEGQDTDLRIEVQPGSYVPQFRFRLDRKQWNPPPSVPADGHTDLVLPASQHAGWRRWLSTWSIACLGLFVALVIAVRVSGWAEDPLDSFWRPVLSSPGQILLCIGNLEGGRRVRPSGYTANQDRLLTMRDFFGLDSQMVLVADAATLSRFAGLMAAKRKPYRVVSQSEVTFTDLQNGPAVLIGLMNNEWTERLVSKLRFTVERPRPGKVVIRDRDNPSSDDWSMDYTTPYLDITKDYALVLRALDPKTDQMVVSAAGISVFGTLAAGEFLTTQDGIRKLVALAPRGWKHKNFEIVLSTDVIRGKSGHPNVVATHFW